MEVSGVQDEQHEVGAGGMLVGVGKDVADKTVAVVSQVELAGNVRSFPAGNILGDAQLFEDVQALVFGLGQAVAERKRCQDDRRRSEQAHFHGESSPVCARLSQFSRPSTPKIKTRNMKMPLKSWKNPWPASAPK